MNFTSQFLAEIRNLIPSEVRKKLDERIMEENLGLAALQNLERCKNCNFAMEMDVPATVDKVFKCPQCDSEFCRYEKKIFRQT